MSVKAGLPATTVLGDRLASVGTGLGCSTVKALALVAVPPGVVTATRPLVAPAGTTKVSVVAFTTAKLPTLTPLRVSVVAPVRLVPVTVMVAPTRPLAGVKLSSAGAGAITVNTTGTEAPPPGVGLVTSTL